MLGKSPGLTLVGGFGMAVGVALAGLAAYQARYAEHTAWISNSGGLAGRVAYLVHQLIIGEYPATHIRPLLVAVPFTPVPGRRPRPVLGPPAPPDVPGDVWPPPVPGPPAHLAP